MFKHIQNSETIDGVTYTLAISEEDIPVRGNAMSSGDAEADRQYEDEILERLECGELWAWCTVWVKASIDCENVHFEGDSDTLGCCCYRGVEEFTAEDGRGYYPDMRNAALTNLREALERAVKHGIVAGDALRNLLPARAKKFEKNP